MRVGRLVSLLVPAAVCGYLATVVCAHPEVPGALKDKTIALTGGTIHPVNGSTIEVGVLVFSAGKITAVGEDVEIPEDAERIDVSGKDIYPGLIDAASHLGLVEIDAVRATLDMQETGRINPNVKAQVAFNPDSELIPVARSNGILLTQVLPDGGYLAGQAALMRLDGWTWEDMTQKSPTALYIVWPSMSPVSAWWMPDSDKEQLKQRDEALKAIRDAFDDALAYRKAKRAEKDSGKELPHDSRWESMLPVLNGEMPVLVAADEALEIQSAVSFAERYKLKAIILGGYDAPYCADLLKRHGIPVIVRGTQRLPLRRSDAYDDPFTVPERLRQSGVKFCISGGGRFSASNVRNLPYHAGMAAAYGLPSQEALKAITLYPAEILGVADRVGSLEIGKDATFIVTNGDPVETPTLVEQAFIEGREVALNDRHKRLWKKYEEKYQRLGLITSDTD